MILYLFLYIYTKLIRLTMDNIYVNRTNDFNLKLITIMTNSTSTLTTKRFVIRKTLIGTNTIITFMNKKGKSVSYNHDDVYNTHKDRFESMNCFAKYKSYTNTNAMPAFCRDLAI